MLKYVQMSLPASPPDLYSPRLSEEDPIEAVKDETGPTSLDIKKLFITKMLHLEKR